MPSPNATPTPITPPRVPIIDPRTGFIDRAWYFFFLSLNNAAVQVYDNPDIGPNPETLIASYDAQLQALAQAIGSNPEALIASYDAQFQALAQNVNSEPSQSNLLSQIAEMQKQIDSLQLQPVDLLSQIAEMQKQIDSLQLQPIVDVDAINAILYALFNAPVTYTDDFSVAATDVWIINNKLGDYLQTENGDYFITEASDYLLADSLSCTATLPDATAYSGRVLYFQNYQTQTLISASSNVVGIGGGAAGTSILLAIAGDQCTLVSDGTNWIMMQYVPNNILLLE